MQRMLMRLTKHAITLLLVFAALLVLGVRDNPGRAAIGAAAVTTSGEATIEYFVSGPKNSNPAVVLLPSYARSVSDFNELAFSLNQAGYQTVAVNPRGIEGSSLPDIDMTLHHYAADVKAVVDAEQHTSVIIVAHAYGNRIARTFAHDYPDLSDGLVLLAAGGEEPTPEATSLAIIKAQISILPKSIREEAVRYAFFAEGNSVPAWWLLGWYPKAGLAQANATRAIQTNRTDPMWAAGGNDPIVVLEPAEDAAAAGAGEVLLHRHPGRVQLKIVKGAGHALLPEQPDEIARLVLEALSSLQRYERPEES
jgi:pimeloyl-ACP methyl ester carboxylesterase